MEESQHAILDEPEWQAENERLTDVERDQAVTDLIELVIAVDGILQAQSQSDAPYFTSICDRQLSAGERSLLQEGLLAAYRWQYILSGVAHPRFVKTLTGMITEAQGQRIHAALATLTPQPIPA